MIKTVEEGENEAELNHTSTDLIAEIPVEKRETDQKECVAVFCAIGEGKAVVAKTFNAKHSTEET